MEGMTYMTSRAEGIPEDVEISTVASVNSIVLREIAVLGILSWGRKPTTIEIEERIKRLEDEVMTLNPNEKGIFIAKKPRMIIGFSRVTQDKNDVSQWWLIGLIVHPNHRRQGIGSALVRACVAYAQERDAMIIRSETHFDNEASIRFHENFGFKNEGKFTAPDGDEKIAFSLTLN